MSDASRLSKLTGQLAVEISTAKAGDTQGQFPILDLIGNLRDEASELPPLATLCAEAWERMVKMVESGANFSLDDLAWLQVLLAQIRSLASAPQAVAEKFVPAILPASPAAPTPPLDDLPLNLNLAEDAELLHEFITESREHLDHIEQGVLVLEKTPSDAERLNTIFRAFHTFKGGAGFLNLLPINRLAHVLESLLDQARQGKIMIGAPVIEIILRGRDVLKQFIDEMAGQLSGQRPVRAINISTADLKAEAQALLDGKIPVKAVVTEAKISAPASPPDVVEPASGADKPTVAVVKVDTGKLDSLLDLVGEMVIAQSLVGQNLGELASVNPQVVRNIAQLGRITKELQRVSMSLRMVPIRGVFQKMSRVVRDISAKHSKKVQLITLGEDTELDRGVVEELNDPLLHMIRNSMDHGLETSEKRVAAGKSPVGTLTLRAYHQGGTIVVEIEDDGAGLNKEKIFRKAVERGLVAADARLTDAEIFNFIFAAGFSTAEKVTDLSGRGVGLDVVRRNIEHLRGRVEISSQPGQGTLFKISLPLTLAIIDGFIVKVGDERYILPTLAVRESFRPQPGMVSRVQNCAEVVNVRGRLIPLLRLKELFSQGTGAQTDASAGIVVVVQAGADLRCLLVDGLLHKQEVVIKNLNEMMVHKNQLLAGAAILGDGRVGLILDINALVHLQASSLTRTASRAATEVRPVNVIN